MIRPFLKATITTFCFLIICSNTSATSLNEALQNALNNNSDIKLEKSRLGQVKATKGDAISEFFIQEAAPIMPICCFVCKLFGVNYPLFPKTKLGHDENSSFKAIGLTKEHWQKTSQIREIFKNSFEKYHLPYFNPHSFRNTLTAIGEMKCKNMQQLKAWSQNLGHSSINTTLISYGEVPFCQQGDLIRSL